MTQPFHKPAGMKKAFEEYNRQQKIRLYKLACWFTAVGMPAGISLDMNIYPAETSYFLKLRLISSALALVLFGLFNTRFGLNYYRVLCLFLPLVPQAFISWMIYSTEGSLSPYYAGLCLILLAFCLLLPWSFQETLFLSLATMAFYLAACVAHHGLTFHGIFFSNFYFLSMTGLFATIGSYFTQRLRVREFELRFELDQNKRMLEESNRKLVELDEAKSRFFANISHELRTPLTLLIAPLQTLRAQSNSLQDAESREVLETMENNAMRLLKLINDLLDLVKLESGRMEVQRAPVNVESFLKGLVQAVQGTARDKRVNLSSETDQALGTLLLDRNKLEKIVLNLLFNALKFTSAGGRVELTAVKRDNRLEMKVQDTGMGISPEDLPFIFDRFWQADSSAQRKYQGTGLGLALVKDLVEVQGGGVTAASQRGKGTTLTLWLPLTEASANDLSAEKGPPATERAEPAINDEWLTKLYRRAELFPAMAPLSGSLRPDGFDRTPKRKLLIADDEPDMLRFLKGQMEKHYEVIEAVDGNQAVEKAMQFLPDLILLDMMMPEKDGIEACRELKEILSTQSIPVILLTARADEDTKLSALAAGANDFLTKPFSTTELHVRVKNLVDSHQFQRDLARQKSALESTLEQLKDTEGQLVQNEKMASLGRLSAGLIHEINNPLNFMVSALHVLKLKKDKVTESEREHYNEVVLDLENGVQRVQRIVTDLSSFAHPKRGVQDRLDLNEVLDTTLRFFSHDLKDKVGIERDVPAGLALSAERNQLIQVFINLFQNAVDAMREKKFTDESPRLFLSGREEKGRILIHVRDNGSGIPRGNIDKIFDPFFTTKDVGRGMGLGLSVCLKLVNEMGGSLKVESEWGKSTDFILDLPANGQPT